MGRLIGLDLGFGEVSGSAITSYDSITKEFFCTRIPNTNVGWEQGVIKVCEYLEEMHKDGGIEAVCIEKNWGRYLRTCESLNKASGAVYYCLYKLGVADTFFELPPTEVNRTVFGKAVKPKSIQRKAMLKGEFIKYLSKACNTSDKNITQDQVDSFCMCLCTCHIRGVDFIL